jgi:hypothetical protein
MNIFIEAILIALLLLVFFQDLKLRTIHIVLPILIAILGIVILFARPYPLIVLLYNSVFLVITLGGLYLYLLIKQRKPVNPFKSIGLGDILFFFSIVPYFSNTNYILFFISGMLFSIFSFLIMKIVSKTNLVPLAGLLALYMVFLRFISYFTAFDFFENIFI